MVFQRKLSIEEVEQLEENYIDNETFVGLSKEEIKTQFTDNDELVARVAEILDENKYEVPFWLEEMAISYA